MKIQDLGLEDRPRERLIGKGPWSLSNSELLAVILRTGTGKENAVDVARNLLAEAGGSLTELSSMGMDRMMNVSGVGLLKAATVTAAFELGRRFAMEEFPYEKIPITNAGVIYRILYPRLKGLDHEQCWVVFLNRSNYFISSEKISEGGFGETTFDVKMIVTRALERKATSIVLVHNHPSGNPRPGPGDYEATKLLRKACTAIGLTLLDHIVASDNAFFSFNEERLTDRAASLAEGSAYKAFDWWLGQVDHMYRTGRVSRTLASWGIWTAVQATFSSLAGLIGLGRAKSKMKTAKVKTNADSYLVRDRLDVRPVRDTYLHTTVTRRYDPVKTKSSGGGGSSYSSSYHGSSGSSHSGSGRSF